MASCEVNLPHNLDLILEKADDKSLEGKARDELINQLHAGVFLDNQKQKFWVDIITGANSFELYARDLSIAWEQNPSHWNWTLIEDTNGVQLEMAELVEVCWLDVKKNFPTKMLTPGTSYEISFVLMMKKYAGFATNPVDLQLVLPNQKSIQRTEYLSSMPHEKWTEIRVGEFVTSCNKPVGMEISMSEHSGIAKEGLVVNKIIIRPVMWKELGGQRNWDGLLSPLKHNLRRRIVDCGKRVDLIYETMDNRTGLPKHSEQELSRLFPEVSPEKENPSAEPVYEVIKYIYAWVDFSFGELFLQDRSAWIGYVAKTTPRGEKVLGRADILICWRGTNFYAEWERNFAFKQTEALEVFPDSAHAFVHEGFYSLYTRSKADSEHNKVSARNQVRDTVKTLIDNYQHEQVSITITGHSLGAALATLNAADIVSNGYNIMRTGSNPCLVTAIVFASPMVGNYGFQVEFNKLQNLHLLHIKHDFDPVTRLPVYGFNSVGKELLIHTTRSTYEGGQKLPLLDALYKFHSLKNYIKEVEREKEGRESRDDLYLAAKKHDDDSWELFEVPIPRAPRTS